MIDFLKIMKSYIFDKVIVFGSFDNIEMWNFQSKDIQS